MIRALVCLGAAIFFTSLITYHFQGMFKTAFTINDFDVRYSYILFFGLLGLSFSVTSGKL